MKIDVKFSEINSKIPVNFGEVSVIKGNDPSEIEAARAEGREQGFNEGYSLGNTEGYDTGFRHGTEAGTENGKQAEYDAFWDIMQVNGKRTDYTNAFGGFGWTAKNFKPKYDIVMHNAYMCFRYFNGSSASPIYLDEHLESLGVTLDFSNSTNCQYTFAYSNIASIGTVDITSARNSTHNMFDASRFVSIGKIIVNENNGFSYMFNSASRLTHCIFEGVIAKSGLNLQWSTNLDKDSLLSIINALKDYSADTSGTTYTVTLGSENLAKLTTEEKDLIKLKGWDYG